MRSLQVMIGIIIMLLGLIMIRQSITESDFSGFGWSGIFAIVCAVGIIVGALFGIWASKTHGRCLNVTFFFFNIILCFITLIGIIMHSVTSDYLNRCEYIWDPDVYKARDRGARICKDRGTAPTISTFSLVFHVVGFIVSLITSIRGCCNCCENDALGIREGYNAQRDRRRMRTDIYNEDINSNQPRSQIYTYPAENQRDSTEEITSILTPSAPPPISNLPNNYPNQPPTLTDIEPPTYQQVMAGDYQNMNI